MSTEVFFCLAPMTYTIIHFYQPRHLHTNNIIKRKQLTKYMIEVDQRCDVTLPFALSEEKISF